MKVINFFGSPAAGKSTAASGLFHLMKKHGYNCELVTEFAKDLIYDGSSHILRNQNFVFANQEFRQHRLLDKGIDFAITDSPLIFSAFYATKDYPPSFKELCFDFYNRYDNINFFLNRSHEYTQIGRVHKEDESEHLSMTMKAYLVNHNVPFIEMDASESIPEKILDYLIQHHNEK